MKGLIAYSSPSGNTKKIAEAIAEAAEDSELISIRESQSSMLTNFDLPYIGYWADRGGCDAATLRLLTQLKDKRVVLFGALEAAGQTECYDRARRQVKSYAVHSHIFGCYLCQGAVGEVVTVRYQSMLAEHPQDERIKQQLVNYENGDSHSDEQDLADARAFAKSIG